MLPKPLSVAERRMSYTVQGQWVSETSYKYIGTHAPK